MVDTKKESAIVHAFTNDALGDDDAVALAQKIKAKSLSPIEVAEAAIARVSKLDSQLNMVETECYQRALAELQSSANSKMLTSSEGFFSGVPTFIKDNTPVIGMPTNHGSAALNTPPAKNHDPYAKQFLAQGFTCLGKSVLPEFGFNATTEHAHKEATKNPWNINFSSGASSGGAAALVASGAVPVAHANDGGGSIRIPAACCGLIGLKPSRGRHVLSKQSAGLPLNLISDGIVSRSVRDTAYFHHEGEKYYRNPALTPIGLVTGPSKRRLRVGMMVDSVTGHATDAETRTTMEATAGLLREMGHQVTECRLPIDPNFAEDFTLYYGFLAFFAGRLGKYTMDSSFDGSKIDGLTTGMGNLFRSQFYKTPLFLYRLKKSYHDYAKLFDQYDLVLTPVLAHTTPELGYISPAVPFEQLLDRLLKYVGFTPLANAAGSPAISLPCGVSKQGLPIAVQFSAFHGDERTLLEIAYEIEEARPWRRIQSESSSSKQGDETESLAAMI